MWILLLLPFIGLLWVPFIHLLSAQLYIYLQSVQAYISPPIAVCFIFGILWTRVNGQGAIAKGQVVSGWLLSQDVRSAGKACGHHRRSPQTSAHPLSHDHN